MLLSGCWGVSSSGSSSGTVSVAGGGTGGGGTIGTGGGGGGITGTDNSVVATSSVAGSVSVVVGASQTISVTFNSSDGRAILGFAISDTTLPAGWSGQSFFGCASVSTGNGCVLNLTFSPAAVGSGTLTLNCVFVDNAGEARTPAVCLTIPYVATPYNNVLGTTSPSGQINAVIGAGSQSVSVNFTTDDGNPATNFILTSSLTTLPSGWTSAAAGLSCAIVSTGNGCQLVLAYAPITAGSGTLTLGYSYTDDSGAARTGALNIPYSTASSNTVVATASPSGQVTAVENTAGQAVAVTFTTDDGKPATGLKLTSNLTALPTGWSSTSKSFSCGSVSTGNGCQLHLTYAPTALTGGMLSLSYSYTDGAGAAQNGLLNIAYTATTNDSVVGTPAPSGQINAVVGSGSQVVAVTFTTNDGRPATALVLTTSLAALPAGWSSTDTSFACSGVSTGTGCQLPLTYAPTAAGNGTLVLSYSYQNNADELKTGSVSIDYRATLPHLYIADLTSTSPLAGSLYFCLVNGDGSLSNCAATGNGFVAPTGIAFYAADFAYVADYVANQVFVCIVGSDGSLSTCAATGSNFQNPLQLAINGNTLYATNNSAGGVTSCTIGGDGTLSNCVEGAGTGTTGIAVSSSFAYIGATATSVEICPIISPSGSLSGTCASTGVSPGFSDPDGISLAGGYAYIASLENGNGAVDVCAVNSDGSLSGCTPSPMATQPVDVAINGSNAYVDDVTGNINLCTVGAGALTGCAPASGGSGFGPGMFQIAVH
jgi:hypothetical protein